MSAERERAERLAEDAYEYESPELKTAYVAGHLASKRLTEAEWTKKREDVARAIWDRSQWDISARSGSALKPWDWLTDEGKRPFRAQAEVAMLELGYTKTTTTGAPQ